ncbi:hypothetical protein BDW02DRAFT_276469 [Decorospora gaudefroyi]|uniref:Uncharacterized protein n=1 Tax=Decorospora gaudefroyi TaxID=184978 RepID=A0A6A5KVT0_9PLEO|nr:hypothetical protein BDW02DRAFT_276469 [Decorospora gaudefroyi]
MKSLRSKASRFFKDSPTTDEKAAIADSSDVEFDAGIQGAIRNKPSRFFGRKTGKLDKALPAAPSSSSSSTLFAPLPGLIGAREDRSDPFDDLPDYDDEESLQSPTTPRDFSAASEPQRTNDGDLETPKLKPQSSFAALKSKGSRFLRSRSNSSSNGNSESHSPPPPPMPQIPVDVPEPKARRSILAPPHSVRASRTSLPNSQGRSISISRPMLVAQFCSTPIPENLSTVPFRKRTGPPPSRPARPESLDEATMALMQGGTRMVLPSNSNRGSASTATDSSTFRSNASSIEARLGFPTGYGTPRSRSLEAPLAARFPADPGYRLPVRDSSGSVRYSRFSEYVRYQEGARAVDGVEAQDRELGPIEQYRTSKEGDWTLEKRISCGRDGQAGGMLFRDRWGRFHFVADV